MNIKECLERFKAQAEKGINCGVDTVGVDTVGVDTVGVALSDISGVYFYVHTKYQCFTGKTPKEAIADAVKGEGKAKQLEIEKARKLLAEVDK